jgi:hypothetical protein
MDDGVVHTGNDTEHVGYESEMGPRNEPRLAKFGAKDVLAHKLAQIGERVARRIKTLIPRPSQVRTGTLFSASASIWCIRTHVRSHTVKLF